LKKSGFLFEARPIFEDQIPLPEIG
jgi:hypothetical protein